MRLYASIQSVWIVAKSFPVFVNRIMCMYFSLATDYSPCRKGCKCSFR